MVSSINMRAEDDVEKIRLDQIIAVPAGRDLSAMRAAVGLFGSVVTLHAYDPSERLDSWFRYGGSQDFGMGEKEAISQFRYSTRESGERVLGPWVQVFNLQNPYLGVTVVHELAHLVDRYSNPPRNIWTSSSSAFDDVMSAYSETESARVLSRIVHGDTLVLISDADTLRPVAAEWSEVRTMARSSLMRHEVAARCITAHVFYDSPLRVSASSRIQRLIDQFDARVNSLKNRLYRYDLSTSDYETVREPLTRALRAVGWTHEQ